MTSTRHKVGRVVSVPEKLRWSIGEAAALCDLSTNYVRELEAKDEFPPRVRVSASADEGGKLQFIAAEVRAWAEGRDWRSMVAARLQAAGHAS